MRRIFIILLVIVLVWAGVWYFYVRPREQTNAPIPKVVTSFFPKATTSSSNILNIDNSTGTVTNNSTTSALREITAHPIAGYTLFSLVNQVSVPSTVSGKPTVDVKTTTDHYIRYVSRTNGYVYEIKNGSSATQITNVFIPNVYEAMFADANSTAILRFLRDDQKTIATYSIPVPALNPDGTRTQIPGIYLPDNITALAVSPDQSHIVRIINDKTGASVSTSSSIGGSVKTLTHSPFLEWLPQWTTNAVYLQTKAASVANGFLYTITSAARLQRVLGDIAGMTTSVSPSGTYVLYSQSTATGFNTELFNTKTNVTSSINLNILPEKCTWLQNEDLMCAGNTSVPSGTYPDDWYQGTMHFSDQLYEIDPSNNTYTTVYDGSDASFDMTNIQVDEGQRIVYFIDKNTGFLWSYAY